MIRPGLRLAALVLILVCLFGPGRAHAQEATPGSDEATVQPLFELTLPEEWLPEGASSVVWYRGTWDVGARLAIPVGSYATGVNTEVLLADAPSAGVNISYLLSGSMQFHIAGPALVTRAAPGGATDPFQPAPPGEPLTLGQGEIVIFPTDAALHIRNVGQRPATLLSALIVSPAMPAGTSPAVEDDRVGYEQLGVIRAEDWAATPRDKLTIGLRRTLLPPGATYGPYEVEPWAPELLSVESGLMEVGLDYDDDGAPDGWFAIQWMMTPDTMFEGARVRTIRASTEAGEPTLEDLAADREPKPGPLVFLTLTFTPLNPPLPTPTPTPEPTETPEPPPTPVTPTAGCEGVIEWIDDVGARFTVWADAHGEVAGASDDELGALDPVAIRAATADLRAFADEQAGSQPPAVAAEANAAIAEFFRQIAEHLDGIAAAIETGDQAAIERAVADFVAFNESDDAEIFAVLDALVAACPEIEATE